MLDVHLDQATGLRKLFRVPSVRVLPVLGGAGDVSRLLQLASVLSSAGERVLVIDQSARDVTTACRIVPDGNLADLLRGDAEFDAVAPMTEAGYRVMVAGQGFELANGQGVAPARVYSALAELPEPVDIVLLHVLHAHRLAKLVDRAGECLMITAGNEAAIASAYQNVKLATQAERSVQVVVDGVSTQDEAMRTYRRLATTAERFLGVVPRFAGWLAAQSLRDVDVRESGVSELRGEPRSELRGGAERNMTGLARAITQWRLAEYAFAQAPERTPESAAHM